ncbi:LamG-like jellyroll fold domain-containing protein [Microbacterium sp. NPDC087592]|uniref:LamG-like jellyroll fold domain-containing protein n=1 Tax=Microbacterium sp. NPDC087592 TaxID=3364193 RepID=UPI003802504E
MGVLSSIERSSASQRWIAGGLVAVLAATGIVVAVNLASSPGADCAELRASSANEAGVKAAACDSDVEVLDERTPWVSVYAQPDGRTRMTVDAVAGRTSIDGEWQDVDPAIATEPSTTADAADAAEAPTGTPAPSDVVPDDVDEAVAPDTDRMLSVEAPVYPMWFNPGGEAGVGMPLGVVQRDDAWVAMRFPLALPTPVIDGRFVTYPLADGVRLTLSVMEDGSGFRPILELDSADATEWWRTALASVRQAADLPGDGFDVPYRVYSSEGLTLRGIDEVGFEIVDGDENSVFWSPQSSMWDSAADEVSEEPVERIEFPTPGDRVFDMPVRVVGAAGGAGYVVVEPNEQMLTDPDPAWPIHIDPSLGARTPTEWIAIRTGGYTSSIYKWADTASRVGESMGYCSTSWTSACVTTFTSRLVWEFGDSTLASWMKTLSGADIVSAEFSADPGQRGNCTSSRTDAYMTDSIASSASNWNLRFSVYQANVTAPQGDACSDAGVRRGWNVLAGVKTAADSNYGSMTFGLKANNETTSSGYKTYKNDARLTIVYNRPPNKPTGVKLASPSVACTSGVNRPAIATTTPTLTGVVSDPDGGTVQAHFQIVQAGTATEVWNSGTLAAKASGSAFSAAVTAGKLVNGQSYQYRVTATDGSKWSGWSTALCEFSVDTSKPAAPAVTPVRTGVSAVYDEGFERGGVGFDGKFTLSRAGTTDVKSFSYSYNSTTLATSVLPDAAGNAVVSFSPTAAGPVVLRVLSVDSAGNKSETTSYTFDVGAAKEDGIWMLDEGDGTDAADTSGKGTARSMVVDGPSWETGPHGLFGSRPGDRALSFDGTDDLASTGPIVDTRKSFVVSAYVWLDAEKVKTGTYTAVSQDGVAQSGFDVSYVPSCTVTTTGCWTFGMKNTDSNGAASTTAVSDTPVVGDQWVHLVGAHDAASKTLRIWVCEIGTPSAPGAGSPVSASTPRSATAWPATGGLVLGRGLIDGSGANWWPGRIDNVRVFSGQVLSEAKIRRMCQGAEAQDFSTGLDALDPTTTNGE